MEDRETPQMHKYGESKTTRIVMATVPHVTSGSWLRKFQADGFLFDGVYDVIYCIKHSIILNHKYEVTLYIILKASEYHTADIHISPYQRPHETITPLLPASLWVCIRNIFTNFFSFDSFYHLFSLKQLFFDSNPRGTPVENYCS